MHIHITDFLKLPDGQKIILIYEYCISLSIRSVTLKRDVIILMTSDILTVSLRFFFLILKDERVPKYLCSRCCRFTVGKSIIKVLHTKSRQAEVKQ